MMSTSLTAFRAAECALREMQIQVRLFIAAIPNRPNVAPDSKARAIESTIHL
jgi:hypothetical protein